MAADVHMNRRCIDGEHNIRHVFVRTAMRYVGGGDRQMDNENIGLVVNNYASVVFLTLFCHHIFPEAKARWVQSTGGQKDVPKTILEPPRYILQVAHPVSASGLSALSLLSPFI